ncbi:MAG: hypothetical protein WBL63_22615, partial [Candidatus Acidiferrum sp.]
FKSLKVQEFKGRGPKIPRSKAARGAPGRRNPRTDLKVGHYKGKNDRPDFRKPTKLIGFPYIPAGNPAL